MSNPTFGEELFERYLQSQAIKFEREPELPGISQRVDFVVEHPGCRKILLEVKDIENDPPVPGGFGFFDPHRPIRTHIEAGKKKFKNTAVYTCALVLAAPPGSFVMLEDPRTMTGAMYGDLGFEMPVNIDTGIADSDGLKAIYIPGKGKMIRRSEVQNTRIAALITVTNHSLWNHAMRKYINTENGRSRQERADDVMNPEAIGLPPFDATMPGVTVYENAVASRKLPKDLFRGDMDAWWEVTPEGRQLPTFIGGLRRELQVDKKALEELGIPEPPA
jgi:hypothetical protein